MTVSFQSDKNLEFSRIVDVTVMEAGTSCQAVLEATSEELTALTKRIKDAEFLGLSGEVTLAYPMADGPFTVTGLIRVHVRQSCGITLKPIESTLSIPVHIFATPDYAAESEGYEESSILYESLQNGRLDIGEVLVQAVALEIDPYPKHPDAQFESDPDPEKPSKPFENLSTLLKMPKK